MSQSDHPETRNFFCDYCGGEIRVPFDLPPTTAPCPFCQKDITSPAPPLPEVPADAPAPAQPAADQSAPTALAPSADEGAPPPPAATVEATTERPAPKPVVVKTAPEVPPTGERSPGKPAETLESNAQTAVATRPAPRRSVLPSLLFLLAALGLAGLVVWGVRFLQSNTPSGPGKGTERMMDDTQFVRDGWKGVATERLRAFLAAESIEDKAEHVIGGESKVEAMREFYRNRSADESGMPLDAFSHYSLDLEDRERGVFLMRYERPAQFDIREFFRPVAPLEVQYGVEEQDLLLSSAGNLGNFAMDPVHAMVFFKRVGDELLIDWETYVQTKYRTLREFSSLPAPGRRDLFRVVIQEDLPGFVGGDGKGRVYRLTDPAQGSDYVKVQVQEDSELGLVLSSLNWIGVEGSEVPTRTATVELSWSEDEVPRLGLARLVCWEFLGLGGTEGNTRPAPGTDAVETVTDAAGTGTDAAGPVADEPTGVGVADGATP